MYDMRLHLDEALTFLEKSSGPALVHCHAGINRSGFMVMAYLMRVEGLDVLAAAERVRSSGRLHMMNNSSFQRQLVALAEKFGHLPVETSAAAVPASQREPASQRAPQDPACHVQPSAEPARLLERILGVFS